VLSNGALVLALGRQINVDREQNVADSKKRTEHFDQTNLLNDILAVTHTEVLFKYILIAKHGFVFD
jgi:hypothetical protein